MTWRRMWDALAPRGEPRRFDSKDCERCRRPFTPRSGRAKWCDGCRPAVYAEQHNGKLYQQRYGAA